jgi:hypothetical protein
MSTYTGSERLMPYELSCTTSTSAIRLQLRQWSGWLHVDLAAKSAGYVHCADVAVDLVAPLAEGAVEIACVAHNGAAFTLALPPLGGSEDVGVVDPGASAVRVFGPEPRPRPQSDRNSVPQLQVDALEEYLRWQERYILFGYPPPVDDGPFAQHARLRRYPLEAREEIAAALANRRHIRAIKCVRDTEPKIGLREAKIIVDALRLDGEGMSR